MKPATLKKLDQFEEYLKTVPALSAPVSVNSFMKGAVQAYYNGDTSQYRLPSGNERPFILSYLKNSTDGNSGKNLMKAFMDSTGSSFRISCKVADLGSLKLDTLVNKELKPKMAEIFGESGYDIKVTGTTLLFV